jgi:hypothetical protein
MEYFYLLQDQKWTNSNCDHQATDRVFFYSSPEDHLSSRSLGKVDGYLIDTYVIMRDDHCYSNLAPLKYKLI